MMQVLTEVIIHNGVEYLVELLLSREAREGNLSVCPVLCR